MQGGGGPLGKVPKGISLGGLCQETGSRALFAVVSAKLIFEFCSNIFCCIFLVIKLYGRGALNFGYTLCSIQLKTKYKTHNVV